jgi:hypothetical protein
VTVKERAQGVFGGAVADRLGGERPGAIRAAAGAAMAGGLTSVVVYRLLRSGADED